MTAAPDFDAALLHAINMPPLPALEAIRQLYAGLDGDIAQRKPICNTSGRCCKFEIWGHRLYVSTLELAWFRHITVANSNAAQTLPLNKLQQPAPSAVAFPLPLYQISGDFSPGCPWQVDGLCTAREARPLGCRIYFCDTTSESWQRERYEYYHGKITELHEAFRLPYRYMEWRHALALI